MKRKPKNHKSITATTTESPLDPGHKSILQSTLDDFFSREPWRSKTDPYNKFCQRYAGLVLEQAEAESEFVERRRNCRRDLNSLTTEALSGRINGLRELVYLATEATRQITTLAQAHPAYVANVAANYNAWPLLWTGGSFSKRQADMLEKIRLGAAKPGGVNRRALGQDPPVTRQWAILLLNVIISMRHLQGVGQGDGQCIWGLRGTALTFVMPEGDEPIAGEHSGQATSAAFPVARLLRNHPDLVEAAKQLPTFEPPTAALWWNVAEQLLRIVTRFGLKAFPRLSQIANTGKVKSLKTSTGTQFNEIVKNIKPVFLNLASPPGLRSRAARD